MYLCFDLEVFCFRQDLTVESKVPNFECNLQRTAIYKLCRPASFSYHCCDVEFTYPKEAHNMEFTHPENEACGLNFHL